MILGNKCDVNDKRVVSKEKGESVSIKITQTCGVYLRTLFKDRFILFMSMCASKYSYCKPVYKVYDTLLKCIESQGLNFRFY